MICEAELRALMERFPGEYCVSVRRGDKLFRRVIRIWNIWGGQEPFTQGYGAPAEPFVATEEEWIKLCDIETIAPYSPVLETPEPSPCLEDAPQRIVLEGASLPSDYWLP
jgi:hypothetical protein